MQAQYDSAHKVPWNEYGGHGVYVEGIDGGYLWSWHPSEVIELWETRNAAPFPGFDKLRVFGTYAEPIALDVGMIEELLRDGAYEDYEIDERMHADLVALCNEWNEKHADKTYWPDRSIAITYENHNE